MSASRGHISVNFTNGQFWPAHCPQTRTGAIKQAVGIPEKRNKQGFYSENKIIWNMSFVNYTTCINTLMFSFKSAEVIGNNMWKNQFEYCSHRKKKNIKILFIQKVYEILIETFQTQCWIENICDVNESNEVCNDNKFMLYASTLHTSIVLYLLYIINFNKYVWTNNMPNNKKT